MSKTMKNEITAGSFAELVVEKMSPLRWADEVGRLQLNEERLQEQGLMFVRLYAKLALALLCIALLAFDLLVVVLPATAVLLGALSVTGAVALLYVAARTWMLLRQL